jgi:flagellar biosynthesis protein FlhG
MHDQASELRQMMRYAARDGRRLAASSAERQRQSRLVAVAGARLGVGTTTIALNLATELARQGRRTILVDADLDGGDVAAHCNLAGCRPHADGMLGVAEVLTTRRSVHEVLHDGPFGLSIVPGVCRMEQHDAWTEAAQDRLIRALRDLDGEVDVVVLDAGRGMSPAGHRFCDAADETLIVTRTDDEAIMDAYATLKTTHDNGHPHATRVLFNRVTVPRQAESAAERLAQTCRRFLGMTAVSAGCLVEDRRVAQASESGVPLVVQSPRSPVAREIERVAATIERAPAQPAAPSAHAAPAPGRTVLATA